MSVYGFLVNLPPARRARYREVREFLRWNPAMQVIDVECPECYFKIPIDATHWSTCCPWCGLYVERKA